MADYTTLKTAVQIAIKANNNNEITGKILQQQLLAMINSLGSYYQLAGILGPSDTPKTDDQRVAYLAVEPGMYEHAGGFEVTELSLLMYDTAWEVHPLGVPFGSQIAAVIKALQDADKANAKAIADEKTSRLTAILAEQQAREQADTTLQENIDKKQDTISDLTTIRTQAAHGQTAFLWGDHSKVGYITGITKAMVEDVLTGNITSHTHTFASLTDKPTTISGYGIRDAYTKAETDRKVGELQGLIDSMFERVYDSNNKLIRVHSNVTISSSGDLVAGGNSGGGGTSGGGKTYLNELLDVQLATSSLSEGDMLMWNGDKYVNIPQSSITPDLSAYATQQWVLDKKYLTSVPVTSVVGQTGNITTAQVATALTDAGYKLTDTTYGLATTTSDGLMPAADKTKLNGIAENANNYTLPTASSSTKGGIKVGTTLSISGEVLNLKSGFPKGTYTKVQIDDYGRVVSGGTLSASDIPSLPWNKITTGKPATISGYGITDAYTKTETDSKVAALQSLLDSMFERVYDSNNKLIRVHSNVTISSSGDLVAGSNSEGGGTSGGAYTQLEWNAIKALTQSESGLLASAYSVKEAYNELNTAIETLAGKATNVKFTQTLTSGKQIGSISIDGKSTSLFAPANYAWSEVTGKPAFATVATSGSYTDLTNKPTIASLMGSTAIGSTTAYLYWNGSAWATKALGSNAFTSISKVSQLTNDSGYITGITKAMVEGVLTGNITSHTHSYLPLSGGTMSNTNVVTNLNADLLDGYHASSFSLAEHTHSQYLTSALIPAKLARKEIYPSGYFIIKINNNNSEWMLSFDVKIVVTDGSYTIRFSEDNRSMSKSWYSPSASMIDGEDSVEVKFGYSQTNKWVAIPSPDSFVGISITNVANGYAPIDTYALDKLFSINFYKDDVLQYLGTVQKTITIYPPSKEGHTHTFASLTSKPTTISGYGITDALTTSNYNSYAPKLDGTGARGTWGINISGNAATATNADTLDGYHAQAGHNKPWGMIPVITKNGWMDVGRHFEFHYDNTTGSDYSTLLGCTGNYRNAVYLPSASGTLALVTDNVASATKLQNSRTIWGQSFDGTGNVNGALEMDGIEILDKKSNALYIGYGSAVNSGLPTYLWGKGINFINSAGKSKMLVTDEGNVGIGTTSPSYKLDVNGDAHSSGSLYVGTTSGANLKLLRSNLNYIEAGTAGGFLGFTVNGGGYSNLAMQINTDKSIAAYGNITTSGGITASSTIQTSGNIIAAGDLTAGSDIRYKDKIQDLRLSVHDIALAPAFTYKWNNRKDDALVHIGSSAQYWLNTNAKDAVYYDKQNDFYHLNYASLALCNTIILARGMETQEEKIARLEARINELEDKLRQYDSNR